MWQPFPLLFAFWGFQGSVHSWSLSSMSPCRLHCLACVYEWHFPSGSACSYVCVYVSACVSMCAHACVQISLHWKRFIIGPVSSVSLPEGNKVEMRDSKTHGRTSYTRSCHTPVPSGGHVGRYDVFQMDTSASFPRNKSAESRKSIINKPFYLFKSVIASWVEVLKYGVRRYLQRHIWIYERFFRRVNISMLY